VTRAREVADIVLLAVSFVLIGYGLFIPAKAVVAQVLLERAWMVAPKDGKAPKPWRGGTSAVRACVDGCTKGWQGAKTMAVGRHKSDRTDQNG